MISPKSDINYFIFILFSCYFHFIIFFNCPVRYFIFILFSFYYFFQLSRPPFYFHFIFILLFFSIVPSAILFSFYFHFIIFFNCPVRRRPSAVRRPPSAVRILTLKSPVFKAFEFDLSNVFDEYLVFCPN